jgi:uncharacterized protein
MKSLGDAVNLFHCCVLTLNVLTVVLPAFLIAGAIEVLLPTHSVMKYLGARAHPLLSYGTSALSGNVLTVCSCNVVPIFQGILKRGAGIGPAFCFVFAAPAIHIVNTIVTYKVIGIELAVPRFVAVPIVAIATGLTMALIFRREERARQADLQVRQGQIALVDAGRRQARRAEGFIGLLMLVLIFGAWMSLDQVIADRYHVPQAVGLCLRIVGVLLGIGLLTLLARKWFSREEAVAWWRQSGTLAWKIMIVFLPAVIVIALIVQHIPLSWIAPTKAQLAHQHGFAFGHPQGNRLLPTFLAALFGTLMYFPMLTEVVFTKGLLLERFAVGPALALLLGGPGLSLPGLLLVSRLAGWRKAVAYWLVILFFITVVAYAFGVRYGDYICSCMHTSAKYR